MRKNVSIITAAALLAVLPSSMGSGTSPASGTSLIGDVGSPLDAAQAVGAGVAYRQVALSTGIRVTNTLDVINGDTSSAQALAAKPGPDGVSLREAVEVTNNDPGSYLINFASRLRGETITLKGKSDRLFLDGGRVTIDGDIDNNHTPDVTLNTTSRWEWSQAIAINSSGNHVSGLKLVGFGVALSIQAFGDFDPEVDPMPTHQLRRRNAISGLDIRQAGITGIWIRSTPSSKCGVPNANPCRTFDTFANTIIAHNTIQGTAGIGAQLTNSGDKIQGLTITDNEIRVRDAAGIAVGQLRDAGDDGTPARISDVVIARNSITGTGGTHGIEVAAGVGAAQGSITEAVQVRNNTIRLACERAVPCAGIDILAGSDRARATYPDVLSPRRYPDDNVLRRARVIGNDISGDLAFGVSVGSGGGGAGGSRNLVNAVTISRNRIQSSRVATAVEVALGPGSEVTKGRYATANRVTGLTITENRIKLGRRPGTSWARKIGGGVVLVGGIALSRLGVVRDVGIRNNKIRVGASAVGGGIKLIGGIGVGASQNSVTCVRISANQITGTSPRVSARPNVDGATNNRASRGGC